MVKDVPGLGCVWCFPYGFTRAWGGSAVPHPRYPLSLTMECWC